MAHDMGTVSPAEAAITMIGLHYGQESNSILLGSF